MKNEISKDDARTHEGHRARMRNKLRLHGPAVFDSYELLEMLLYYVVPKKDTNPIAHRLLSRFETLDGVFSASREELCAVSGVGERTADFLLSYSEKFSALLVHGSGLDSESFRDYAKTGEYFVEYFMGKETPETLLLLLDNKMTRISLEHISDTDFSSGKVRIEEMIKRAIERRASIAILAHNHPHGPLFASFEDHQNTIYYKKLFSVAGIVLAEHYLVTGRHYNGILPKNEAVFRQGDELEFFYKSKEGAYE